MNILWLSWKDQTHPHAGGAEVVKTELCKRLVADGHTVTVITSSFTGAVPEEIIDGVRILRLGNRFTVYWLAYRYYKTHLRDWPDVIIDEINTIPFFASWYADQPVVLFVHQLAREIWFYEMMFPLSLIGYLCEPLYLRALAKTPVITVSQSTRDDLLRFGFAKSDISIISEGIALEPVTGPLETIQKFEQPTLLSLGSIRPMKQTKAIVHAFEIAKVEIPQLELILAGNTRSPYGEEVTKLISESPFAAAIHVVGMVSEEEKIRLMQRSHLIAVTSIKEGWGLIVTEANSQGTPAVVYNRDGLRDSVQNRHTGLIASENTPDGLADAIVLALTDTELYASLRHNAWIWSQDVTFARSYADFINILKKLY